MNRIHTGTYSIYHSMFDASVSAEMYMTQGFKELLTGNTTIVTNDTMLTKAKQA
jgi:hypothetical protein